MRSVGKMKINAAPIVLVFAILTGLMVSSSEGFIEFKKSHRSNTPEVCGIELCDKIDSDTYKIRKNHSTPLGQYTSGTPLDKIICKENLEFVIKSSNWHPACVKSESVTKLIQIGWAANPDEYENIHAATANKEDQQLQSIREHLKRFPLKSSDVGIGITPNTVDGKRYLIFDGYGWHRLHNVEITISNEGGEVEFLLTKTTDHGDLYMPWQIPNTILAGLYNITATDGIHTYEISIPIISP